MTNDLEKTIEVLERIYNNPDSYGYSGVTADVFKNAIKTLEEVGKLKKDLYELNKYYEGYISLKLKVEELTKNLTEITMWALKKEIISMSRASELLGIRLIEMRKRTNVYFSNPPRGWDV